MHLNLAKVLSSLEGTVPTPEASKKSKQEISGPQSRIDCNLRAFRTSIIGAALRQIFVHTNDATKVVVSWIDVLTSL